MENSQLWVIWFENETENVAFLSLFLGMALARTPYRKPIQETGEEGANHG